MTGVSVLVNTSFNTRSEPIVCTPRDAIECFAIRAQVFPEMCFEINVVSDGLDSLTANLIKEINDKNPSFPVCYYELPEKKGPAAARNFG